MTLPRRVPKGKVRLVPRHDYHIPGVPHVAQDVEPARAEELLAYTPRAFDVYEDPEPVAPKPKET